MSLQKFDHKADHRLITGVSGTGKTELWMGLIENHEAKYKFIYDHQGEFAQRNRVRKVCKNGDDFVDAVIERRELIVFDPIDEFPGKAGEGFNCFCDLVFSVCSQIDPGAPLKGHKLLAIDELQLVTEQRVEPIDFLKICETGRRYQIDIIASAQAPNRLHNAVRNQMTWVATFRHSDKRALEYLEDQGFDVDQVRALPDYEHLWKDLRTGKHNFDDRKNSGVGETEKTNEQGKEHTADPIKAVGE